MPEPDRLSEDPRGRAAVADRGPRRSPAPVRAPRRRRRIAWALLGVLVLAAIGGAWLQVHRTMPAWYARLWYPLEYEDAIRTEAARYDLDPALVAAVINTESGFVPDSHSSQGAVGLMQVLPETARFVARGEDRPSPSPERLQVPAVNIAYGSAYLRYLIDRYGTVPLALAAYNGGETNLTDWLDQARRRGADLRIPDDIPFSETREFVKRVLDTVPIYRRAYGDRLFTPSREGPVVTTGP
jgi:soluble lytic murein transglycosylase